MKQHKPFLTGLDGIRGLLALAVALVHTNWTSHFQTTALYQNGTTLVDLFFVFSGFLMYRLYLNSIPDMAAARTFLKKRIARLYPVHVFTLFIMTAFACLRVILHDVGIAEHQAGEILPFSPVSYTHLTLPTTPYV